jgi:hypothetical protein
MILPGMLNEEIIYPTLKQGWEKTREIRKNPWEWEKLVFTGKNGKNGKNCLFSKPMFKKHFKSLANKLWNVLMAKIKHQNKINERFSAHST